MAHRITFLDVFAERPLTGNGLAVVESADELDDRTMLAFAKETKLSETSFVQTSGADGADYRNRIWDPHEELPFAGHPSLGTAVAVARWRGLESADFVQETRVGLQPVEVHHDGRAWRADMLQGEPEFGPEVDREEVMAAVGLYPDDGHPELPPQIVSTGMPTLIAPVGQAQALVRAEPDYPAIYKLVEPHGSIVLYLAWCEPDDGRARARSFTRTMEMGEDPATGSAAGPLCAYLAERTPANGVVIRQGQEMGRPSVIEARMVAGHPRVGGEVIPLIDGTVELPR